jgi:DNA replication protein DnaC
LQAHREEINSYKNKPRVSRHIARLSECLFTTASALTIDLGAQESRHALQRRLKHYESRDLLIIDEIGYQSFDCRAADFIFEIVNRRYEKSAICISTNLAFKDWAGVFPGAPALRQ